MTRVLAPMSVAALLMGVASGQSPAFQLADVHVSAKATNPSMRISGLRGDRYEVRTATMLDLIRTAYSFDADKILGGPSWLETDRFDVIAKTPPGTTAETAKLMLQTLLADRFNLTLHKDTKDLPGYALTAGKKPQLKEPDGSGETGCKYTLQGLPQPGPGGPSPTPILLNNSPTFVYTCHNMTMAAFAEGMRTLMVAQTYIGTGLVVDKTELKGAWDFNFKYSLPLRILVPSGAGPSTDDQVTLFAAIEKLGLKLDPVKIPTPVLVVDSVNQTPSANPPGVTTKLPPPPPAEFDVADIKPSAPGAPQGGIRLQAGGRLDMQGMPLKSLITLGWEINGDEMLAGAPKWLDTNRFDVIAKMSTPPSGGIDVDALRAMIRALVVDRFKMATHYEDRPMTAYTLLAVKPKLTKADPSNRTACKEGAGADGKDPRIANPTLSRLLSCQNMTMAQFADRLPSISNGMIRTPVMDSTGIEGAWDFTLSFSPPALVNGAVGGGRGGDLSVPTLNAASSSDPTGALSLMDAVSKQLGLKLEMQKRPLPALVIDHIEEKPTDN